MEKTELVAAISQNSGISTDQAAKVVDAFVETIKEELLRGEKVTIAGFGTFSLSKRKGKTFINPKTNKAHDIPEKMMPRFRPGSNFNS